MPRVEDHPGAREIERRGGVLRPRQARQAPQVLARPRMFGIGSRPRGQPLENLLPPLPHDVRHPGRVDLFAKPVETVGGVDGRRAEERAYLRRRDALADQQLVAGLQTQRHLAADRLQTAGELTDPPLARVVRIMRRQAPRVNCTGVAISPAARFCAGIRCVSAMAIFSASV